MAQAQILVATDGKMAQVRVIGPATFACSQELRAFGEHMLQSGVAQFVLDLSECASMDSTFMGVLAMIGKLAKSKNVPVSILNASQAQQRQLASLGVKKFFAFGRSGDSPVTWRALGEAVPQGTNVDPLAREKTILEAHETLMAIDPANIPKFKDVVEFLREDIQKLQA